MDLCGSIQTAADVANKRIMYEDIKRAIGLILAKSVPIRSKTGKAPGGDSISPEVIKNRKGSPLKPLHAFFCLCWEQDHIPQEMRDANIITLYKNKGCLAISCLICLVILGGVGITNIGYSFTIVSRDERTPTAKTLIIRNGNNN
ncbi:hypothetical protein HELRODRAFT_159881 [Helobdella robusta]|uniref:Uncharacterized protein n=1 Tax=Helobdella robusta TaxID=6412 RepID=T1EPH6_HELRO|nr:hypothetical protein HELRODRAFT_159881 [Helobdella robusta]ESO13243.1 hypothetical protein HELRODRAFT_159881 [Helobdella robusta]